jgi:excisionase family DNA binding protein
MTPKVARYSQGYRAVVRDDDSRIPLSAEQSRLIELVFEGSDLLSPSDAAEILNVSRPMVVRWINEGRLSDYPAGTHHRVSRAEVLSFKEERISSSRAATALVLASRTDATAARQSAPARAAAAERLAKILS